MTNRSKPILVDTDVWVGYFFEDDAHYASASQGMQRLMELDREPIATDAIVGEVLTVLSHKAGREEVVKFYSFVIESGMTILPVSEVLNSRAIEIFLAREKIKTSYVDCVNIAAFEYLGLDELYSFDKVYHKEYSIPNFAYVG